MQISKDTLAGRTTVAVVYVAETALLAYGNPPRFTACKKSGHPPAPAAFPRLIRLRN